MPPMPAVRRKGTTMSLKTSIMRELAKGPATAKQLRVALDADNKKIAKTLNTLVDDKKLRLEKNRYSLRHPKRDGGLPGRLVKLGRGFGFAEPLDGSSDIFIPGRGLAGAMPGDEVMIALEPNPRVAGSREGEIVAVSKPQNKVVGTVEKIDGRLALLPDNARETPLSIKKSADGGVKEGEKAAGQILERGDEHDEHLVAITMRFGSASSARQNAKAILYAAGIEKSFSDKVKAEAKQVAAEKITKEEIKGRADLRDDPVFTIDSAHTKDMDDAISVARTKKGYSLGVHIADVSHYVQPKTPLDEAALRRGTSVYYADSVVPMLPRPLSNGACSLNEGEDRLALSCIMKLNEDGSLDSYKFAKTVIRSRVKGVYEEINALFGGSADEQLQSKYAVVAGALPVMQELYHKLAMLRGARGSLEIESEEAVLRVDEEGRCIGVERRRRGEAERMIEEFMLLANTAAAHLARSMEIPFLYRVHDKPKNEKVEQLERVLHAVGLESHFAKEVPTQKELQQLLDETRGSRLARPVHQAVLRSMAKAKYEPKPKGGHYGLALSDYAHFTSPIRRYPDLGVHRILSDVLAEVPAAELRKRYKNFVEIACEQATQCEIAAQQAERDCDDCYKAEYMQKHIGETFTGVISSVVQFGIYVELDNSVEGMIHISHLADGHMDLMEGVSLSDPLTGKSYRIGDEITVRVAGADVSQGNVDFEPVHQDNR